MRAFCFYLFLFFHAFVSAKTIITGATVIDGLGGPPIKRGTLIVDGGVIEYVGSDFSDFGDATVIDASGKYIIPGLMDANVHLFLEFSLETLSRYENRYDGLILESAQIALKYGLTTVFDSWGPLPDLISVRDKINSGKVQGSRIFMAGNIVGYDGPLSDDFYPGIDAVTSMKFLERVNNRWDQGVGKDLLWLGPEGVREKLRKYLHKDIDFIKYAVSGHAFGEMQFIAFSPKVQKVIVEEARKADFVVQTHTTSIESLRLAIEAGVDILQHCDDTGPIRMPDNLLKLLKDSNIYCSTLSRTQLRRSIMANKPRAHAESEYFKSFSIRNENTKNMINAGVKLLLSTDASVFSDDASTHPFFSDYAGSKDDSLIQIGKGHFNWLKAIIEKGMSPMDALMSATSNIAKAYKVDDYLGTLEKGKVADFIILNSNPLSDVNNYRDIHSIFKGGVLVDRDALPENPVLSRRNL